MTAAHPAPTKLRAAGSTKTLALCILFAFYISGDVVGIQKRLRSFGVPETEQKNHVRIGTSAAVAKGKTTFVEETKWPDFNPSKDLNFAVIGWPKTGTSFLLNVLGNHPEVTMPNTEFCDIVQDGGEKNLTDWMENKVREMNNSSSVQKFGIKCPGMIRQTRSIENLMKLSDSTRLVVGVRHPVLWFESFYNYRVRNAYRANSTSPMIIPVQDLDNTHEWRGLSPVFAKFDLFLKQLGKVSLGPEDTIQLGKAFFSALWDKRVTINPYRVFIYTPEQLSDKNDTRQEKFRADLQKFLRLEAPIADFNDVPPVNANDKTYPETIDICDPQYKRIKNNLVRTGARSSEWIIDKFIKSKDVLVSGEEYFIENLKLWAVDPCIERALSEKI